MAKRELIEPEQIDPDEPPEEERDITSMILAEEEAIRAHEGYAESDDRVLLNNSSIFFDEDDSELEYSLTSDD